MPAKVIKGLEAKSNKLKSSKRLAKSEKLAKLAKNIKGLARVAIIWL